MQIKFAQEKSMTEIKKSEDFEKLMFVRKLKKNIFSKN